MSQPLWISLTQLAATTVLGAAVAYIAYRQWKTARERGVLDLFEKRWESYEVIRGVIAEINRHGACPTPTSITYLRAIEKAEFLFGDDVNKYLKTLYQHMIDLDLATTMMEVQDQDHASWVKKKHESFREIIKFYDRIGPLLKPYMQMKQRMPSW